MRKPFFIPFLLLFALCATAFGQDFYVVSGVESQPMVSQAMRLRTALQTLGSPLNPGDAEALAALGDEAPGEAVSTRIQEILDPYCIAMVHINPEMRVKIANGPAQPQLVTGGWRSFLVKVHNESGTQAALNVQSPNMEPTLHRSSGQPRPLPENEISPGEVAMRFLEGQMYRRQPMNETLSGLELEYQVVQFYTTAEGQREARISFNAGAGTEDLGFRNAVNVLFDCEPAVKVVFRVRDYDGSPTMASFTIVDNVERIVESDTKLFPQDYRQSMARRRPWEGYGTDVKRLRGIYPLPSRRVADYDEYPDFFFHPQIYRADGEHVYLPPGKYDVTYTRGPEYIPASRTISVPVDTAVHTETFDLKRWIHMKELKWYSADHHVHAGGCSHYESPVAGVQPAHMFREALGEDLNIACVLTWGPCWYHQKTYFEGKDHALSQKDYVMRYDVEVSGFPSSHAGHLCLLRLKEDDYPGTTLIEEWPSWTLPVLKWGQEQGGVVGYSHSGWGLEPLEETDEFPNYVIPKMDGIGANEFIVTVVHDAVDFISSVDTPLPWELNIWYHTLNCGFRTRISGETDYPCIYDDRVGMGRSYAKLDDRLDFDAYTQKIKEGANYVSDGLSHIVDFKVDDAEMGIDGSELRLDSPERVKITAKVAAYLPNEQTPEGAVIAGLEPHRPPYWDIERARIGDSRKVNVELVVNGYPVDETTITADGEMRDVSFTHEVDQSSWIALRVMYSSHTNPIFVLVDDQPIRASKKSAQWCLDSVDRCWEMKVKQIREEEQPAARAAYDYAKEVYGQILSESSTD